MFLIQKCVDRWRGVLFVFILKKLRAARRQTVKSAFVRKKYKKKFKMTSTPLTKRVRLSDDDNSFKTPPVMRRLKGKNPSLTPGQSPAFEIPPSPSLKQLGFGTGL